MKIKRAYTLVETIIAALFIGIALITIAAAFTNSSHILQKSRHILTAVAQLQKWAEFYRNQPFSSISTGADISLDISGAPLPTPNLLYITIQYYDADGDSTSDTDIKKLSLKISWNEGNSTITKRLSTLITENGINPDE